MIKTVFLIPRNLKKLQFMSWYFYVSTVRLLEMLRSSVLPDSKQANQSKKRISVRET